VPPQGLLGVDRRGPGPAHGACSHASPAVGETAHAEEVANRLLVAVPRLPSLRAQLQGCFRADLIGEVAFDLIRHVPGRRQVAEVLVALQKHQEREPTAARARVLTCERNLVGRRLVERFEFAPRERRLEARVRGSLDRGHREKSSGVQKGWSETGW